MRDDITQPVNKSSDRTRAYLEMLSAGSDVVVSLVARDGEPMKSRFTPFDKPLSEVQPSDLQMFRSVSEGWYVEYKSQPISVKALAKSLSAFANQYGGWLVLGIKEDSETLSASTFPGLAEAEITKVLESIRNASKDALYPEVFYETRVFEGPIDEIELAQGRSILIVRVPPHTFTLMAGCIAAWQILQTPSRSPTVQHSIGSWHGANNHARALKRLSHVAHSFRRPKRTTVIST